MIGLTLMILLSALATLLPVGMGPRANPLVTPEVIKPEWFFYVAFRWLKLFSGTTAVLTQGLIVFVMFFWPFIDEWLVRQFKYADISVWIGVVGALTIMGFTMWEALVGALREANAKYDTRSEALGHRRAGALVPALAGRGAVARGRRAGAHEDRRGGPARPRSPRPASRQCVDCHTQVVAPASSITGKDPPTPRRAWGASTATRPRRGTPTCSSTTARQIATIVTPRDCARCHPAESAEFARQPPLEGRQHPGVARQLPGGDRRGLARRRSIRIRRRPARPCRRSTAWHPPNSGCQQCHGSLVAFQANDGGAGDDARPEAGRQGPADEPRRGGPHRPQRERQAAPVSSTSWPNTGIGRLNLDGSLGSCAACHSRHDFSARRARQPENCGKCHLGPDHPQKEIYEESKHGVAFRDLIAEMNLDARPWVLGQDYSAAPTCATCHMSANTRNGMKVTHDPGERISWTNRPPVSLVMDTDANHDVVTETDPEKRRARDRRHLRGEAQPHEAGVLALPHARLHQPVLPPVRRPGGALQREVRQARPGDHERPGRRRA